MSALVLDIGTYHAAMRRLTVLAALTAILLVGCQGGTTGSASPSASPSGSSAASQAASPSAEASAPPESNETIERSTTDGILPPESLALVMVDNLRVRGEPSLAGPILHSFDTGTRITVVGNPSFLGPVVADGYDWYLVVHRTDENDPSTEILGWAAAGDPATPFLATLKPRCDRPADVLLTAYEQLACYGDAPLTLEGTYGCGGCGGFAPGTFEPGWLANPISPPFSVLTAKPGKGIGRIDIHVPPELLANFFEYPVEGSIIRVVGHFDDPAATTCQIIPGDQVTPGGVGPGVPADSRAAIMYCRERFVVDSYVPIGTDPSYPGG
jgi:hypothetical protein